MLLALACVGCSSQPWAFYHGEPIATSAAVDNLPTAAAQPAGALMPGAAGTAVVGTSYQPPLAAPNAAADQRPAYPVPANAYPGAAVPTPTGAAPAGPPGGSPVPPGTVAIGGIGQFGGDVNPLPPGTISLGPMPADFNGLGPSPPEMLTIQGVEPGPLCQPAPGSPMTELSPGVCPPPVRPPRPCDLPMGEPMLWAMWDREWPNIRCDYANYYSWPTAIGLAAGFGIAAGVANSDLDGEFQKWYQTRIDSRETGRIAKFWKPFGQGQYTIPVAASLMLLNDTGWLDDQPVLSEIGQWGDRVTRAYMVGAPPMLAAQYLTGGSRPSSTDSHSTWKPFSASNGVSGDAFMSTCLFVSAADMTDQLAFKVFFYACSFMVPWERIDQNQHFLSQAALGWWMGYLACRAVDQTELNKRNVMIVPIVSPEMSGVGVVFQH